MVPYNLNGRPTAFWRGDWYVGKGIAHARLRFGPEPEDVVEVFNTHTHAPYSSDHGDSYRVHREAQTWTLAKMLRGAAERGHLVVAAGDFNMTPLSREHRIITGHAPVRDVWRVLHPDSSLGAADEPPEQARGRPVPSAELNVIEHGVTSNSVYNTWRWAKPERARLGPGRPLYEVPADCPDPRGKRLDYIFASTAARELSEGAVGGWVVQSARVGMLARHPDLGCSLSDHFSVEATLAFHAVSHEGTVYTAGTSIAGASWPLPPGRRSNRDSLSAFRRSMPRPPKGDSHGPASISAIDVNTDTNRVADVDADADEAFNEHDLDDPSDPRRGTFLSLASPTPSTSRPSLRHPDGPRDGDYEPGPPGADFDAQLLSSLLLPDGSAAWAQQGLGSGPASGVATLDEARFAVPDYDALLADLKLYAAREADQARMRAWHFLFWVFVLVASSIAVWLIPTRGGGLSESQNHAINFVLVLLTSVGLVAGSVDGLMSLLFFGGSEKRALKEFEWELRNAKALALGDNGAMLENAGVGKF